MIHRRGTAAPRHHRPATAPTPPAEPPGSDSKPAAASSGACPTALRSPPRQPPVSKTLSNASPPAATCPASCRFRCPTQPASRSTPAPAPISRRTRLLPGLPGTRQRRPGRRTPRHPLIIPEVRNRAKTHRMQAFTASRPSAPEPKPLAASTLDTLESAPRDNYDTEPAGTAATHRGYSGTSTQGAPG